MPRPTAVFFGDGYFNHRDHRVTGWATLDAVAPAAGNPHYFPEHIADGLARAPGARGLPVGHARAELWIDIGDTLERKIDGLFCHASQLVDTGDWFREFLRERAEDAGPPPACGTPRPSGASPSAPDRRSPADARSRTGGFWRRHSAMARSTSTATMPTPAGADRRRRERADQVREVGCELTSAMP